MLYHDFMLSWIVFQAATENLMLKESFAMIFSRDGPAQNIIITVPVMTPNHKCHKNDITSIVKLSTKQWFNRNHSANSEMPEPSLKAHRFKLCNSLMSVINTMLTCHRKHYVIPYNKAARAITQQSRRLNQGWQQISSKLHINILSEWAVHVLVIGNNVEL